MNYEKGFKDAIELFEASVNKSITKGIKSKADMIAAFDSIISTIYVAKLSLDVMEEETLESILNDIEDCDDDCENCHMSSFGEMLAELFDMDIFKSDKEVK